MGANTKIEWCDFTFNPWIGCTKVSPACDNCYAEALMDHRHHRVQWGGERSRTSATNWKLPLRWNESAKRDGIRQKVFCASLADVFDNQVPDVWRSHLWALIAECTNLDWLLLTKRPQNIAKMLPSITCEALVAGRPWPWPHVWLGATAEDQERYDQRAPHLVAVDCAKRFISYEPALAPIDFLSGASPGDDEPWAAKLDVIICGGESGPHARPMHPSWARSARDQCQTAGIYFFFKQWGEWGHLPEGDDPENWPNERLHFVPEAGNWMLRVGKSRAGRLLDGREHSEFPG